jgi:tripartite-type tricarboxylate transporter receptor subunit TctC
MTWLARAVVPGILAVAFAAAAAPAGAQDYPSRPITIVVPQAPAASSDLLARTLASACTPPGVSR